LQVAQLLAEVHGTHGASILIYFAAQVVHELALVHRFEAQFVSHNVQVFADKKYPALQRVQVATSVEQVAQLATEQAVHDSAVVLVASLYPSLQEVGAPPAETTPPPMALASGAWQVLAERKWNPALHSVQVPAAAGHLAQLATVQAVHKTGVEVDCVPAVEAVIANPSLHAAHTFTPPVATLAQFAFIVHIPSFAVEVSEK
jgi:hypothetical protein